MTKFVRYSIIVLTIIIFILACRLLILNERQQTETTNIIAEKDAEITRLKYDLRILRLKSTDNRIEKEYDLDDVLNYIEPLKESNKQEYLRAYKELMYGREDTVETIYDYTNEDEFNLICQVVSSESGICDFNGKVNVASTIINRYFSEVFPDSWEDLIFQSGQYSVISNKSYLKAKVDDEIVDAVEYAFMFESEVKDATYFCSNNSEWHNDNLVLVYEDSWHKFYKEGGGEKS